MYCDTILLNLYAKMYKMTKHYAQIDFAPIYAPPGGRCPIMIRFRAEIWKYVSIFPP